MPRILQTLAAVGGVCIALLPSCESTATQRRFDDGVMAVSYSGFRAGQHPDRGAGAKNPSREQVREDLEILVDAGFDLIRLYDAGENSRTVLEVIRDRDLPIAVLLGAWLSAELSNHEGCGWLTEPIPAALLAQNRQRNDAEVARAIALAKEFDDIVVAMNVGNELLVEWTDHLVPLDRVLGFVRAIRAACVDAELTVAENYDWWRKHGAPLAAELDFVGVHTYPVWEGRGIDDGLAYTIDNVESVRAALPGARIAVLEAGWATTASEFGERASESAQRRYFEELSNWGREAGVTVFWFEAFDEPWKGDPNNSAGAEKHWGLFFENREAKQVMQRSTAR